VARTALTNQKIRRSPEADPVIYDVELVGADDAFGLEGASGLVVEVGDVAAGGGSAAAAIEDRFLAGARDERAMDGSGVLLTGATRRLPPANAVEPERGFEPLTCSLRVSCSTD
jgi:hypothetical protein